MVMMNVSARRVRKDASEGLYWEKQSSVILDYLLIIARPYKLLNSLIPLCSI